MAVCTRTDSAEEVRQRGMHYEVVPMELHRGRDRLESAAAWGNAGGYDQEFRRGKKKNAAPTAHFVKTGGRQSAVK